MLPNLKTALAVRDVRQIELAREINISAELLSRIVRGWTTPSSALRARIADFLDADEGWLFARDVAIPVRANRCPPRSIRNASTKLIHARAGVPA